MASLMKLICRLENKFDRCAERFVARHPFFAFFAMFVGMPIVLLALVCIGTALIVLPLSWLFGSV